SGIITGSLYALVGASLVVIYRASKVLNFALGGFGAIAADLSMGAIHASRPYPQVFIGAAVIGALCGFATYWLVIRPLASSVLDAVVIATVGVLLVLEGLVAWRWTYQIRAMPAPINTDEVFRLGPLAISPNDLIV